MDLKDKVAIVTGASAGIGAATVKALLDIGMKVVGFARRKEKIEKLVDKDNGKLFALSVDVTKPQEILDGFAWVTKHVGPVHVLINNAGVSIYTSVVTGNFEAWQKVMDTNFMSVAIACKEAINIMKEHNIDGYIININSVFGYYDAGGDPYTVMYRASKQALVTMTENIRIELANMGSKIRITTLGPGVVKTDIIEASGGKELSERFYANIPHLHGDDIANTIVYLLKTPPHVHITELLIRHTGEDMKNIIPQK